MTALDLNTQHPRSPKEHMAGLVSLARMTDKARAAKNGTLGEYHYDCPHDKPLLEWLGVDAKTFQDYAVAHNDSDLETWVKTNYLKNKSESDIKEFNEARMSWKPEPDSAEYFNELRQTVAPNRPDIVTWFDVLDLDEGRPVDHPHK